MWGACQSYIFRVVLYGRLEKKKRNWWEFLRCLERLFLLGVIKDFLYSDWKLLRGNEIVYKLRRFVDFGVLLNYYFGLRTFPVSAAQIVANGGKMGGIEERWDDPSKPAELRGSAEEWHHVRPSFGRREREAGPSLLQSLSHGVLRIQPIIAFIFSPNFVGLETRAMQQGETTFYFSNFETKQKLGIFTRGIGKSGYS